MTLGFTGTSRGMTQRQHATVRYLFIELQVTKLHHGCCIGADAEAHRIALEQGVRIVGHPPRDTYKMAALEGYTELREPYKFLTRNRHIVRDGVDGIIAAPKTFILPASLRGEGTWTTVNYARQAGRRLWIVAPDGTFREEASDLQRYIATQVDEEEKR